MIPRQYVVVAVFRINLLTPEILRNTKADVVIALFRINLLTPEILSDPEAVSRYCYF